MQLFSTFRYTLIRALQFIAIFLCFGTYKKIGIVYFQQNQKKNAQTQTK